MAGKILWLFWCGICAEVDELLPTVVDFIRREANMKGLQEICWVYHLPDPGSCTMQEQRPQSICCGLPLALRSKPSGQVQLGVPPL
ncbi:hypothetical protein EV401DRAFT_1900094 [Pisolithus croceorrhizus]|nr:hypothetical protein EV401DRAFT_1900094 [Pisolithus croceorrhizus]